MHSVLVTGGTGFFGQAFVRYMLKHSVCERIVIFSRNEFNQHLMAERLKICERRLRFMIGDVRDKDRLRRAMHDVDTVIHAAALKRIEAAHYNPLEFIQTNIVGSANVVESAIDAGVSKVILLSSDKAFAPVSLYGATKKTAEELFLGSNNMRGWTGPIFSACRYGNVWNSTGSVLPRWRMLIAEGTKRVRVTDPDCTRFFMRIDEAIELVMRLHATMKGGEIAIPTLPAYRLGDLAEALEVEMEVVGLPAWEKKHESMAEGNSSDKARLMSVDELRGAINDV